MDKSEKSQERGLSSIFRKGLGIKKEKKRELKSDKINAKSDDLDLKSLPQNSPPLVPPKPGKDIIGKLPRALLQSIEKSNEKMVQKSTEEEEERKDPSGMAAFPRQEFF